MIYTRVKETIRQLITASYCRYCLSYGLEQGALCAACSAQIAPPLSRWCRLGTLRVQVHALSGYEGPLLHLVRLKYHADYEVSVHLGTLLAQASVLTAGSFDYLVPVPITPRRFAARGYNHAYVMAHQMSLLTGIPVVDGVRCTREYEPQTEQLPHERPYNVLDAFAAQEIVLAGMRLLIIDDTLVSGATMLQVAYAVSRETPVHISGLVVCRSL